MGRGLSASTLCCGEGMCSPSVSLRIGSSPTVQPSADHSRKMVDPLRDSLFPLANATALATLSPNALSSRDIRKFPQGKTLLSSRPTVLQQPQRETEFAQCEKKGPGPQHGQVGGLFWACWNQLELREHLCLQTLHLHVHCQEQQNHCALDGVFRNKFWCHENQALDLYSSDLLW